MYGFKLREEVSAFVESLYIPFMYNSRVKRNSSKSFS
jgi:hypothetical protein